VIGQRTTVCADCGLYDTYAGDGDGIGSCDCPRCEECGAPPQECDCDREDCWCEGRCWGEPDRPIETVTAFAEKGIL
jgi:hypothetical protein